MLAMEFRGPSCRSSVPATINSRSVIHGVAHVLRLGVPSRELILESPAILSPETYWKYVQSSQNS